MFSIREYLRVFSRFMRTPSLGRSVVLLLAAAILLLLSVNAATFIMIGRTAAYNDTAERIQASRRASRTVMITLLDAETGQRGYILTGRSEFLRPFSEASTRLPEDIVILKAAAAADAEIEPLAREVEQLALAKLDELQITVDLARMGRTDEAIRIVRDARGKVLMDRLRAQTVAIDILQSERFASATERSEWGGRVTVFINALAGVLIVVMGLICAWLVRRYVADMMAARSYLDRLNAGLEDKVRERTSALSRANEEIQRFAYIVSHDLRAPLVNIMGYTAEMEQAGKAMGRQIAAIEASQPDLLDRDAAVAVREDVPEAIGFIRTSSEKMDRLINAILKLSREGRRNLTAEALDMTAMVQAIADSVRHQTAESGATIVVEPLPVLVSDRLSVEQVFGNLIDNAVKYLDLSRPGLITISGAETDANTIAYRIVDNGRGIAPRDHERIFELFRRAGRQDRTGEGLGLAFVRNSVRRIGGEIHVESALGEGSTFILTLPKHMPVSELGEDA